MKVYDQLEKAQAENVTSYPSGDPEGMVVYHTTDDKLAASNGTAYKKILDEDTISGAQEWDEVATPSTPAATKHKLYYKSDGKLYTIDSTGTEVEVGAGGGGGGGKNYVPAGSDTFDSTVGDWVHYDDAAEVPTSGAGAGGGSDLTVSRTTTVSEVLGGDGSLKLAKAAANAQGEGASVNLDDLDRVDEGRTLYVSFDYETTANYVTDRVKIYVYNLDGTSMHEVTPLGLEKSAVGGSKFSGSFVPTSGDNSYRLIVHVASNDTDAWDVMIDNISFGPAATIQASVTTEWESWTPTGTWIANTTYTGRQRRVGDTKEYEVKVEVTGGAPTTATLTVDLPSGDVIDTAKLINTGNRMFYGQCEAVNDGNNVYFGRVEHSTTTSVRPDIFLDSGVYEDITIITATSPFSFGVSGTDTVFLSFKVPIVGLDAGAVVSNTQLQNQTISARYTTNSNQSYNSASTDIFDLEDIDWDSHNAVTTGASWKFTAPRKGRYYVNAHMMWNDTTNFSGTEKTQMDVYKNGVAGPALNHKRPSSGEDYPTLGGNTVIELEAGDYIDIRIVQESGATLTVFGSTALNYVEIYSLPDFTTYGVVKDQIVNCRYTSNTATNISSLVTIPYEDEDYATPSSTYNTTTGVFTAPVPGKYHITAGYFINGQASANNQFCSIRIYVNAVQRSNYTHFYMNGQNTPTVTISDTAYLDTGDTVEIKGISNDGFTTSLDTDATKNYLSIEKVD